MTILYGYAISFDLKKIPVGIVSFDKSPYVRDILLSFSASDYFNTVPFESTEKMYEALKEGRVKCGLVFPYNFSKDKAVKGFSEIQVLVDGSDANLAKKVQQTVQRFLTESRLNVRFLYNPELRSRNFVIPGLIVVLTTMLGVILTRFDCRAYDHVGSYFNNSFHSGGKRERELRNVEYDAGKISYNIAW
jgi:ABC-2 type transport system permease protein